MHTELISERPMQCKITFKGWRKIGQLIHVDRKWTNVSIVKEQEHRFHISKRQARWKLSDRISFIPNDIASLTRCIKYRGESTLGVFHQHGLRDFHTAPGINVLFPFMCPCPQKIKPPCLDNTYVCTLYLCPLHHNHLEDQACYKSPFLYYIQQWRWRTMSETIHIQCI